MVYCIKLSNITSMSTTSKTTGHSEKKPAKMKMWRYRAALGDFVDDYNRFTIVPSGKFIDLATLLVNVSIVPETWIAAPKNPKDCLTREQLETYANRLVDMGDTSFIYGSFHDNILMKLKKIR